MCGGDSLRAGPVRRSLRSDLDLSPVGECGLGRLHVRGKGKTKGSVIDIAPSCGLRSSTSSPPATCGSARSHIRVAARTRSATTRCSRRGVWYAVLSPSDRTAGTSDLHRIAECWHGSTSSRRSPAPNHQEGRAWYGLRRLWADRGEEHLQTRRAKEVLSSQARGSRVSEQFTRARKTSGRFARQAVAALRSARRCRLAESATRLHFAASWLRPWLSPSRTCYVACWKFWACPIRRVRAPRRRRMRRTDLREKLRDGHLRHRRPPLSRGGTSLYYKNLQNRDGGI